MPQQQPCPHCDYIGANHWNLRMHYYSNHATKEERKQQKYYCEICDNVFFCSAYYNKHVNGKRHKNQLKTVEFFKNNKLSVGSTDSTIKHA